MDKFCWRRCLRGALACAVVLDGSAIYNTDETQPPSYCTVFHHMVKSGGSTIKYKLRYATKSAWNVKPGHCASCDHTKGPGEGCLKAMRDSPIIRGSAAELLRAPLENMGRKCSYFTMMRHPVDRLVSAFFYCPANHDLEGKWCDSDRNEDSTRTMLVEYATHQWGNKAFSQMLGSIICPATCRNFCESFHQEVGKQPDLNSPEGHALLEQAQETLGTYAAVGIMEEFILSMELFNATVVSPVFDWTLPLQINKGQTSWVRNQTLQWAHLSTEIRSAVAQDLLLYDHAVSLFRQQTSRILGTTW